MANLIEQRKNEIIALLIVAVTFFGMRAINSKYSLRESRVARAERELKRGRRLLADWKEALKDYAGAKQGFFRHEISALKRFVEDEALDYNVNIGYVAPSSEDKGLYWDARIDLAIEASYGDMVDFIRSLEDKGIGVDKITIQNINPEGEAKEINLVLKVAVVKE